MNPWTPIRPTSVDVVGIHPRYARLLVVHIGLDRTPPSRWRELFLEAGFLKRAGEEARFEERGLLISLPDDELEAEVVAVEHGVRLANARYSVEVRAPRQASEPLPPVEVQVVDQETFSPDVRTRMAAARGAALRLSGVFESASWEIERLESVSIAIELPEAGG